jgi:hypothetical protein
VSKTEVTSILITNHLNYRSWALTTVELNLYVHNNSCWVIVSDGLMVRYFNVIISIRGLLVLLNHYLRSLLGDLRKVTVYYWSWLEQVLKAQALFHLIMLKSNSPAHECKLQYIKQKAI